MDYITPISQSVLEFIPAWVKGGWAEFEAVLAQTRYLGHQALRTLPPLLEPCQPPLRIAALTYADFMQAQRREARLQQVVAPVRGEHASALRYFGYVERPQDTIYAAEFL